MQQEIMTVTTAAQARALQDAGFLGAFLEPRSPSDVARTLGMAPNLAHHHAKRHAALGLLLETGRERGKVYYQLAARTFRHGRSLLPPGDDDHTSVMLAALKERFHEAYQRSAHAARYPDEDWCYYSFTKSWQPADAPGAETKWVHLDFPTHFESRTLTLSGARYRQLVSQIQGLIAEAQDEADGGGTTCTVTFVAFDGALKPGSDSSHSVDTFLPPANARGN